MKKDFFDTAQFYRSSIAILKNRWFPFILGIPLFFCLHHYEGIKDDAVLYLLQVIHSISPERFLNDPPFMFGNQDSLGFFTPLYKLFLDYFSIAEGTKIATFSFQLIWIVSLIFMVKEIGASFRNRLWILPTTILFIGICAEGTSHFRTLFFYFIQHYNCSRLLSVAIGLAGLAFLFSQKKWLSLAAFTIGTIIHPLTSGWGIPVWLFVFFPRCKYVILLFSAILPFSFLFHIGSLDVLPDNWLKRPLLYAPDAWDIFRISTYVLFLWYYIPNKTTGHIAAASKAIALTLFIAYYWNLWGCLGKHILFYQLQTWRVEWLAWAVVTPLFINILINEIKRYKSSLAHHKINHVLIYACAFLSLYILLTFQSTLLIACLVGSKIIKKSCPLSLKQLTDNNLLYASALALFVHSIFSIIYTEVVQLAIEGTLPTFVLGGSFHTSFSIIRNCAMVCTITSILFSIYAFLQKKWLATICFIVYVLFPYLLFLPLLGLFLLFYSPQKKCGKFILICLLLFCFIDIITPSPFRCKTFFDAFLIYFKAETLSWLLTYLVLSFSLLAPFQKRFSTILFLFFFLSIYAFCSWDNRLEKIKISEITFETFKKQTIFPYIQNRGKIFFYVTGDLVHLPRLQFLTGAYLSYNTHIGEIFYKEQFFESQKRDNYLFYKKQMHLANEKQEYIDFTKKILSNPDSLIDRTNFLCQRNEISHLVSDMFFLPYTVYDSLTIMPLNKKIYLYQCP